MPICLELPFLSAKKAHKTMKFSQIIFCCLGPKTQPSCYTTAGWELEQIEKELTCLKYKNIIDVVLEISMVVCAENPCQKSDWSMTDLSNHSRGVMATTVSALVSLNKIPGLFLLQGWFCVAHVDLWKNNFFTWARITRWVYNPCEGQVH